MSEKEESIEPKSVGLRIRKIRKNLGYSMTDFASKIDSKAKSGTVSNWETGKNLPNNARLKRITEIGNVTMDYLLYGKYMMRDIHMMPKVEQEKLWDQQKKQLEDMRTGFIRSTQSHLNDIDLESLPNNELYLLNHFTRFMKNYRNIDNGHLINVMFATFAQLNRLYDDAFSSDLSTEKKIKSIDFYITDLINESNNYYKELAEYLKEHID